MNMHIYNEHVSTDITISNEHSIMLISFNKKKHHKNGKAEDYKHFFKIMKLIIMYMTAKI